MKRLAFLVVSLAFMISMCLARSVDEIPNVHVADRTRYVSNPDGVLSQSTVENLDVRLGQIWAQTSTEPVVVVIDDLPEDSDIDSFATELFSKWQIGKADKDNGLLILVARNDRKAVIRTGYGVEGVLPDIICGRILRNEMFPLFQEGDFDSGVTAAVESVGRVLTDPAYAEELRSAAANDSRSGQPEIDTEAVWETYLSIAFAVAVIALVYALWSVKSSRKLPEVERYERLRSESTGLAVVALLTLGMGLPALIPMLLALRRIRKGPRRCSNCHAKMEKMDELRDNDYLSPAQDAEERLNSVDYDVWVCPECNQIDVIPFVNSHTSLKPCAQCGARTDKLVGSKVLRPSTSTRKGQGVKTYHCQNCGRRHDELYEIPVDAMAAIAAAALASGVGRRGDGGFGGFSGGSFGGGMTGGGGASGGW